MSWLFERVQATYTPLEREGAAAAAFSPGEGAVVILMKPTSLNRGEGLIARVGGIVFKRWEGGGDVGVLALFIGSQCVAEQKKERTLLTWALLFCCH